MKKSVFLTAVLFCIFTVDFVFAYTDISLHQSFAGKIDVTGMGHTLKNADDSIMSSSTASLALPANVTVKAAFLYWAGSWNSRDGGSEIDETVTISHSGGANLSIDLADQVFEDDFGRFENPVSDSEIDFFGCFKDITSFVNENKGGDYTFSDLTVWTGLPHSGNGTIFGGWAIFVVFEHEESSPEPMRVINIYDGFKIYYGGGNGADSINLTASNFRLLETGNDGKLAHLSWEGDVGNSNEYENLYVNDTILTTAVNVENNQYNSTRTFPADDLNAPYSSTSANDPASLGMDLDIYDITGYLSGGLSSVTTRYQTGSDMVLLNVEVISVTNAPVADLAIYMSGEAVLVPGTTFGNTISVINNGPNDAESVTVTTEIPFGISYVPGSATDNIFWVVDESNLPQLTWTYVGDLSAYDFGILSYEVTIPAGFDTSEAVVYTANVTGNTFDNVPDNNTSELIAGTIGLTVEKTSSSGGIADPGSDVTYTVDITNTGTLDVTGVTAEDNMPGDLVCYDYPIRVTEYYISGDEFSGTDYSLRLNQALSKNYFVIVQGSDPGFQMWGFWLAQPDQSYAALTGDPFGTGDLDTTATDRTITLSRKAAGDNGWTGVVTVAESISDHESDGFTLVDAAIIEQSGLSGNVSRSSGAWTTNTNLLLIGGYNGAGVATLESGYNSFVAAHSRIWSDAAGTINWSRDGSDSPGDSESTVMAVIWGSNWEVQTSRLTGTAGNDGAADSTAYIKEPIQTPVARKNTWVWGTGHTDGVGVGDAGEGILVTLGDGVVQNDTESYVAVGSENPTMIDFQVYTLTHPEMSVDHIFKEDGNAQDLSVTVSTDYAGEQRMALVTNGQEGVSPWEYPMPLLRARYTSDDVITLERLRAGRGFPAWVQGIDFSEVKEPKADCNMTLADGVTIAAGETLTLTYSATISPGLVVGDSVTNTVSVTLDQLVDPVTDSFTIHIPEYESWHTNGMTEKDELFLRDSSNNNDHEIIYTGGTGFGLNSSYNIAYYDNAGLRVYTDTVSSTAGELVSAYSNTSDTAYNGAPISLGEWTSVIVPGSVIPADTLSEQRVTFPAGVEDTFNVGLGGAVEFTDATGTPVNGYDMSSGSAVVYISVTDRSARGQGTLTVTVYDDVTGDSEAVTLTETRRNSGVFTNTGTGGLTVSVSGGGGVNDGTLSVVGDETIRADYVDGAGNLFSDEVYIPLRALIVSFDAVTDGQKVTVVWETASELKTIGFHLERMTDDTGNYKRINKTLLPGLMTSAQGGTYQFEDTTAPISGGLVYRLIEVERTGKVIPYGPFTVNPKTIEDAISDSVAFKTAAVSGAKKKQNSTAQYSRAAKNVRADKIDRMKSRLLDLIFWFWRDAIFTSDHYQGDDLKITVNEPGFYLVSAAEIAGNTGRTESYVRRLIRLGSFDLRNNGKQVAWQPINGDEAIGFYGVSSDSVYSDKNRYILSRGTGKQIGSDSGRSTGAVSKSSGFPDTVEVEENKYAMTGFPFEPDEDYWLGDVLIAGNPSMDIRTYETDVPKPDSEPFEALLAIELHGASSTGIQGEHRIVASVNDEEVGEGFFTGAESATLRFEFDGSLLSDGTNRIEIKALLPEGVPYSLIYINKFSLRYQRKYIAENNTIHISGTGSELLTITGFEDAEIRVFDITDARNPKRIAGAEIRQASDGSYSVDFNAVSGSGYWLTSGHGISTPYFMEPKSGIDLKSRRNTYSYIVIAPDELKEGADYFAAFRRSTGETVLVVTPDDIEDAFSWSQSSPEAMRDFLAYAWKNWRIKPTYLLLAGDGTCDYKNYTGNHDSVLPPVMVKTDDGLFASDNWLVDVSGNDGVPEIAAGRLPVTSSDELIQLTDKIRRYESAPDESWKKKILFVSDDSDAGGDFETCTTRLSVIPDTSWSGEILSLGEKPVADVKTEMIAGLNNGCFLMNYLGHGGMHMLTGDSLFSIDDIGALTNHDRLPVITAMTCLTGNFSVPGYDSLAEYLVRSDSGGAVAVISPTGTTVNPEIYYLNRALIETIVNGAASGKTLGNCWKDACRLYEARGNNTGLLKVFVLFGDPATRIGR